MSADRLAEIKAREQAAFGGPWHVLDADENGMHAVAVDGTVLVEVGDFCDAEFIAASRDDIPHLLALVESLTAERDALAEDNDRGRAHRLRAEQAEAEADRLRATAKRVERLASTVETRMMATAKPSEIRAALWAEPTDDLTRCDCGRAVPCRHCESAGQEGDQ